MANIRQGLVLQGVNDEMQEFMIGIFTKIAQMTEKEWAAIVNTLPFQVPYQDDEMMSCEEMEFWGLDA